MAEVSGVLTVGDDYLLPAVRAECEHVIPDTDGVKPCNAADTFLFLKAQLQRTVNVAMLHTKYYGYTEH